MRLISSKWKFSKLEQFFLLRYINAPKRNLMRFSFVFMVSGIVLSVGILSAGLNLFEGYEKSLKDVLLGSFPHISLQDANSEYFSKERADQIIQKLNKYPQIASVTPSISYAVMASNGDRVRGASLNAYDFSSGSSFPYSQYITQGSHRVNNGEAVIGKYLAKELGKGIGDSINVFYPRFDRISAMGLFSSERNFRIVGIYSSGYYENDRSHIICSLSDAEALLNINPSFSRLELRLDSEYIESASVLANAIQSDLGIDIVAYPWSIFSAGLLKLVAMEKWLIFIIFSFLVLIAGINVISAVTTIILDKKNEIAVLKTLGAKPKEVKGLIALQVGLVGFFAIIAGQVFGAGLSILVEKQGFYRLKGDVYFIDTLTATISPLNQFVIFAVAAVLVAVCIAYPLKQIDKMQIMDLLRNR